MSPIQSAPNRGYADWQRVENWDGGLAYSIARGVAGGPDATGVLDVSRFAYVGGYDLVSIASTAVVLKWYTDPAGTNQIGQRGFTLSPSVQNVAQYRLPNLGPFVSITWNTIGGGGFSHTAEILPTNRVHPLEFIPQGVQLIQAVGVAVNAGQSNTQWPVDYYAGPVHCEVNVPAAGWVLQFFYIDNTGAQVLIDEIGPPAGRLSFNTVAPPGAWQAVMVNTTGANGNYWLRVNGTQTGSL